MNLADDVDASRIDVGVDGGTVALSGEVDTWRQWRLAVELAYDACAVKVQDKLGDRDG